MIEDVVELLRCPHCGGALSLDAATARCATGHAFDVARQGYLNLLPGDARTGTADTTAMVRARAAFLDAGHYGPLVGAVADAAVAAVSDGGPAAAARFGAVLDVGAGTGHYLATVLEALPEWRGIALDVSKHALRVAARDPGELARVLAPGGALVVVTPAPDHLRELVVAVGMLTVPERKRERLEGKLGATFERTGDVAVERELTLRHGDLAALVGMGPSARHLSAEQIAERVAALPDPLVVTLSATVATYRRAS